MEKYEGKRPPGRPRCRWEDNIKIVLQDGTGDRGLGFGCSGWGQVVGSCKRGNEPSDTIKCGAFVDQLGSCQLLRKDYAPWSWLVMTTCTACHYSENAIEGSNPTRGTDVYQYYFYVFLRTCM